VTTIRPEVVSLMVDVDHAASDFPGRLIHQGGRPFTKDEADLVLSATWDEVQAARDYFEGALEIVNSQAADYERLGELTRPYFDQAGPGATFADLAPLMTPEHLAEFLALQGRLAPDGYIVS
jgi:hypothetical protein